VNRADPPPAAVLAVDGGNSKSEVALVSAEGDLLAARRGPTVSHQQVGLEVGMERLGELVDAVLATLPPGARGEGGQGSTLTAGRPAAELGVYSLAGADFRADVRLLGEGLRAARLARRDLILNDTFGALRAGTHRPWGVVLICGQGINAAAVAPNGRSARFMAIGSASGDWGGGGSVGWAGLAAAVRARDGRGPRTSLERSVPAHFGSVRPEAVSRAIYDGRIAAGRIGELSPVVFAAAGEGDPVAREIVDRLADELATMATALIRRLHLTRLDPEVVLAGGVFRTDDAAFYGRIETGIQRVAPRARTARLTAPPVLGAALLGLDRLAGGSADPKVEARIRAAFDGLDLRETASPASGPHPPRAGDR
jgi:N-acetylglucosamine kinase-like BadF-type ATPase